jgi:hypothetical protein
VTGPYFDEWKIVTRNYFGDCPPGANFSVQRVLTGIFFGDWIVMTWTYFGVGTVFSGTYLGERRAAAEAYFMVNGNM